MGFPGQPPQQPQQPQGQQQQQQQQQGSPQPALSPVVGVAANSPFQIPSPNTMGYTQQQQVQQPSPVPPPQQGGGGGADLSDPFAGMSMASAGSNEAKYRKGEDVIYLDGAMNSW